MIDRIRRLAVAAATGAIVLFPASAIAADASVGFRLSARVEPFCRIQSELGGRPATFENGIIELGAVREVCNTRGGYSVDVEMVNVASGTLHHGAETHALDPDGRARITSRFARARTHLWRLTDSVLRQEDAPVYLRVSISPL